MRLYKTFLILCSVVLLSCAAPQQTVKTNDTTPTPPPPDQQKWNEDFDPLTLNDYKLEIEAPRRPADEAADVDLLLRGSAEKTAASPDRSQIPGFRVQLVSTRDEEEARSVMRNAVISFAESVYREYDNPYYKIRVGDFRSRYDATKVQEQAIELGFHEAWVVRAMIWDNPQPKTEQTTP